jgi:hypothetical protein
MLARLPGNLPGLKHRCHEVLSMLRGHHHGWVSAIQARLLGRRGRLTTHLEFWPAGRACRSHTLHRPKSQPRQWSDIHEDQRRVHNGLPVLEKGLRGEAVPSAKRAPTAA